MESLLYRQARSCTTYYFAVLSTTEIVSVKHVNVALYR